MENTAVTFILSEYVLLFLVAAFSATLFTRKRLKTTEKRHILYAILLAVLLELEHFLELRCALDPALRFWRILLSVFGYVMAPGALLMLIFVIEPDHRRRLVYSVPEFIDIAVFLTAFFCPVAFSFDRDTYYFDRGPLGYTVFIVTGIYFLLFLYLVYSRFSSGRRREIRVLLVCVIGAAAAIVLDVKYSTTLTNVSIVIGSIFYYLTITAQYSDRDALTSLLNRNAYYDDCDTYGASVTAIAAVDMNGLKEVNDTCGHDAGDAAIQKIAHVLQSVCTRNITAYRMGGDEFVLLFRNTSREDVTASVKTIMEKLSEKQVSVSMGFAYRESESLELLGKLADRDMYTAKSAYYSDRGRDRRKR